MEFTASELADFIGAQLEGDAHLRVSGCASVASAGPGDLVYVDSAKHLDAAARSRAVCVILGADMALPRKTLLRVKNPRYAFAIAMEKMLPAETIAQGIHPTAIVAPSAKLAANVGVGPYVVIEDGVEVGAGTQIGAHCFLGRNARLGSACRIYPRVTIYSKVRIGSNAVVHSGAVIGSDGFGFVPTENGFVKFPQRGTVEIGDDVEIGANTTIDRGALDATHISRGVKIDNLVQIAHNNEIGENTVIAGQAGIAGSSTIGKNVIIGGQVGISDHCRIGDGALLVSQSGVAAGKVIRPGMMMFGSPVRPMDKAVEILGLMGRLPELARRVKRLEDAGHSEDI
jgi:UDP-3-O-[3-hydroxymyristoyl] glucosamine N-acyltransferase